MNKYIEKYKSMSVQARAALWFVACSFLQKGISFITVPIFTRLLTTDQYGTAWNPKDPADGCTLKIEWIKEFDADKPATYVSADSAVTYSDGTYVFTLDLNPDGTVNNKITISADYIKYLAEQGKTSIKLDFKSKDGQKVFFDAWGSGGKIKMQNLACNLDAVTITDDMKTNGYTVTIAAKDIGKDWGGTEDADGYILTITVA